ncbi:hypothetical protein ACLOJK_038050 [Asimina triloba]
MTEQANDEQFQTGEEKYSMAALEINDLAFQGKGEGEISTENVTKDVYSDCTKDGSVDRKGNPAIKACSGGWKAFKAEEEQINEQNLFVPSHLLITTTLKNDCGGFNIE